VDIYQDETGKWHWKCTECGSVQPVRFGERVARMWADAHERLGHREK
jgi:hypothetical protein